MNFEFETESDRTAFVEFIASEMLKYQRDNGITEQCVNNCQIFYDILRAVGLDIKIKPTWFLAKRNNETEIIISGAHVIPYCEKYIWEVSYEFSCLDEYRYYDSISSVFKSLKCDDEVLKSKYQKLCFDFLPAFKRMTDISDRINSGEFVITDVRSYHAQMDYLEKRLSEEFNFK
jgi:hypothetical protein